MQQVRSQAEVDQLYQALTQGDRVALGRAITLVESRHEEHINLAAGLLDRCLENRRDTIRFAISGSPGVGKSTFIEALGNHITSQHGKLAVLAIDPSSSIAGGAILGDKTRMATLSNNPDVFIRPSPAGRTIGGVADRTREVIAVCEAAGFDTVCIETVGVGQSEYEVTDMTDLFVLLVQPGGGDDLQGIKRGIVELADLIVVNKSDGELEPLARQTRQFYAQALRMMSKKEHDIPVEVLTCSALLGTGLPELWDTMMSHIEKQRQSGHYQRSRNAQRTAWLHKRIDRLVLQVIEDNAEYKTRLDSLTRAIIEDKVTVTSAISDMRELLTKMLNS